MNRSSQKTDQKQNELQIRPQQKLIEWEKNVSDNVQNRVNELVSEGRLNLPKNYALGNAMASAWLIIQETKDSNKQPALQVCTKESVANALLDMAVLGLNPAKKHGYFVVYGKQLSWFTSYFGKCAVVKRLNGIDTEPIGTLIYEGDELELSYNELGEELVINHTTSWKNKLSGKIVGAYASVFQNGKKRTAVMTMNEIRESWTKNPSPKNTRDHTTFAGEFAKRTVINRLTKMIIQTSNDDDLLAETYIENEDKHYDFEVNAIETTEERAKLEIATSANTGEVIDIPQASTEVEHTAVQDLADIPVEPKEDDPF